MDRENLIEQQFEAERSRLRNVAYRMLGSRSEAEDAVQEAWLRLSRSDTGDIGNLAGWLTTVVARVSLDMLRSRKARKEESLGPHVPEPIVEGAEQEALFADSIGLALLVVLETLTPAERVAFVLHDMFDLPFDEIGPVVGRSPAAARQLASRARRRVRGKETPPDSDRGGGREIVEAFLAASRRGDFAALLAVLDPEVVLRADAVATAASVAGQANGAPRLAPEIRGAPRVAETFAGRAQAAQHALLDGAPGLAWAPAGDPRAVFRFAFAAGRITSIDVIAHPSSLASLEILLQGS